MFYQCYNMTWTLEFRQIGRAYLALAIPAFIFHVLFWMHVATHRALRQISMLWVYNYLFTDILLLVQFFVEYTIRTMSHCIAHSSFYAFCNVEAYTNAYMTVLEAYMLVCLNITRYYLIVKNCNISTQYPYILILFNICLYLVGISVLLLQVELFQIVKLHPHHNTGNCHFNYLDIKTQYGNLIIVLLIPIILNCYFMILTTIHVRRSQQAVRSQRSKHLQLLIQFFVVYIFWLVLWAPNVVVSHIVSINDSNSYTRFGSLTSALCDPLIFMFIDRRFLKVWKKTSYRIIHCGRPLRQIYPTTITRVPDATVTGDTGRRTSFEVTVNNKVIYSKLELGRFPDFDMIAEQVENATEGRNVEVVTKADKKASCSIL
ncbi:unnamed protein product [Rotaria sordida]|uniref:G-protein coupled receptors family 1 profile domain-containing protein n=1 Tax=Rotaria sordida TaxID=392033 RepID=A0A813P9J6_9BILA|nr:unnamed protein product [Rotaria sordida]